jgi:dihydroorotate dehydrogenase electron transfer subunit
MGPRLLGNAQRKVTLRRPFSFCDIEVHGDKCFVEILYCVVGPSSLRMMGLVRDDRANIIGPLGRGFWMPEDKKKAIFIIGGMGAGPLQHFGKVLTAEHPEIEITVFAGAKSKQELPFSRLDEISEGLGFSLAEFGRYGIESHVATDDGSAGFKGFVTDRFSEWLKENKINSKEAVIYACGPEVMMGKVAEIARGRYIDCQVSMERRMGCGIGLCQSCAVQCRDNDSNETIYKLCCKDGPVFDAKEVVF